MRIRHRVPGPTRGAACVAVAAVVVTACSTGSHAAPAAPWDPGIAAIARFVAHDRGLGFAHPVPVHLLDPQSFQRRLDAPDAGTGRPDPGQPTDAQRAAELRALGVTAGATLTTAISPAAAAPSNDDTVGFYDDSTKAIFVDGTALTPYVRVTVAHELTHALQDQRLGLSALDRRPDDQQPAISALVEGDAVDVEDDYRATFSPADEKRYEQEEAATQAAQATQDPPFVTDQADLPYDLGPTFVDALIDKGGNGAIDAAFRDPPTSEAEIADPSRYLAHEQPTPVAAPPMPPAAERLVDLGAFGQVSLADVVGTRTGYTAWAAVAGWEGDHATLYGEGGRTCVAIDVATQQPVALVQAASTWAAGLPDAAAHADGDVVHITSCDPGAATAPPGAVTPSAYEGVAARASLLDDILRADNPPAEGQAECAADRALASLGVPAAVAYDHGDQGAPADTQVAAAEKAGEVACAGRT